MSVFILLCSLITGCIRVKRNSEIKRFVGSGDKISRQCDFSESSLRVITEYFKQEVRKNAGRSKKLDETYRNITLGGWEYLFCTITGKIIPEKREISLPSDLLLSQFTNAGILPQEVHPIIMGIVDEKRGVVVKRLPNEGESFRARLTIFLDVTLIDNDKHKKYILNSLPAKTEGFFRLERNFIKRDVFPIDLSFTSLTKAYVKRENASLLNTDGGKPGVIISYNANVGSKTVIVVVNDEIHIDLEASIHSINKQGKPFQGNSAITISNIEGIHLLAGEDPTALNWKDYVKFGGNLAKVFRKFTVVRSELDFHNGTARTLGGGLNSILDFSYLFRKKKLKNSFDKDIIVPILESLCKLYIETVAPILLDVSPSSKEALAMYKAGSIKVVPLIDHFLGANPDIEKVRMLINAIYQYKGLEGVIIQNDAITEDGMPHSPDPEGLELAGDLSDYLYKRFVKSVPHQRVIQIRLPEIDAATYFSFVRPL